MKKKDATFYMRQAILQAKKALKGDEVPIGAVVVNSKGDIIGRGYNRIEKNGTQLAHAECLAIKKACKKAGNWRLNGCMIYVTLEPCLLCFGLIHLSRMRGIVYAATSTLFGVGLKNLKQFPFYTKKISVEGGILEEECLAMLKNFFEKQRKKRKDGCEREKKIC